MTYQYKVVIDERQNVFEEQLNKYGREGYKVIMSYSLEGEERMGLQFLCAVMEKDNA